MVIWQMLFRFCLVSFRSVFRWPSVAIVVSVSVSLSLSHCFALSVVVVSAAKTELFLLFY